MRRPKVSAGSAGGHDWGSPAAARAVEQLLAMGAQVRAFGEVTCIHTYMHIVQVSACGLPGIVHVSACLAGAAALRSWA